MRQHQAVFANFICKFGNEDMADYLREIVLPAFTDDTMVRRSHGAYYHLLDIEVVQTIEENKNEPAIYGRFVKDI